MIYSTFLISSFLLTTIAATEMTRSGVKQSISSSFSRKHRILSLQICVRQTVRLTRKPNWLQNLATDAGMCVHCTRHMSATPATWCSASVTREAYHKTSKLLVSGESGGVMCTREGKRTSLWTSAKPKPTFSERTHYTTVSEPPTTVHRGKHVVSRLFAAI